MLLELRIRNLATISQVELLPEPGFNVFTGETGAGKSMLVQAVQFLLGAKADPDLVRTGAEEAVVEARFQAPHLAPWLEEHGLPPGDDLILRRLLHRSGRSRAFINDQAVTLKLLAAAARELVTLAGQHEHQTFLAPENHLAILDAYAGLRDAVAAYRQVWLQWRRWQEQEQRLRQQQLAAARNQELYQFQIQELEQAQLRPGEEEELHQEQERLRHAGLLWEAARRAYGRLYGDKGAVLETLGEVGKALELLARFDPAWQTRQQTLTGIILELEDLAFACRDYLAQVQSDPHRLEAIEHRLHLLQRLQRKYGGPLPQLLAQLEQLRQELAALDNLEAETVQAAREAAAAEAEARKLALALSRHRQEAASALARAVEEEIRRLALPRAQFLVRLSQRPELNGTGVDEVEFLWAPNPGEDPRPLARIASGGELSRLVLGLKRLLAAATGAATNIFDEVDAGIGGTAATVVGKELQLLGRSQQILCVTHLPQIACFAATHFRVEKQVQDGRTITLVHKLTATERAAELARMLGGTLLSPATLAQAQELLRTAQRQE